MIAEGWPPIPESALRAIEVSHRLTTLMQNGRLFSLSIRDTSVTGASFGKCV